MAETSSCLAFLTLHNYHTWKIPMTQLLHSKGLWSCLDEVQLDIQRAFKVMQHKNEIDEAMGLISLQVSNSLQFYLDGCTTPQDMWTKLLDGLFGIVNEFRTIHIEEDLASLALYYFPSIEDFMMKFKQQRSLLHNKQRLIRSAFI